MNPRFLLGWLTACNTPMPVYLAPTSGPVATIRFNGVSDRIRNVCRAQPELYTR